jgi:tetratricopeptide (TPR) repeat protein
MAACFALDPQYWTPDSDSAACQHCGAEFGAFLWRHHCRFCGDVFCAGCSSRTFALVREGAPPDTAEQLRVCDACHPKLLAGREEVRQRQLAAARARESLLVARRQSQQQQQQQQQQPYGDATVDDGGDEHSPLSDWVGQDGSPMDGSGEDTTSCETASDTGTEDSSYSTATEDEDASGSDASSVLAGGSEENEAPSEDGDSSGGGRKIGVTTAAVLLDGETLNLEAASLGMLGGGGAAGMAELPQPPRGEGRAGPTEPEPEPEPEPGVGEQAAPVQVRREEEEVVVVRQAPGRLFSSDSEDERAVVPTAAKATSDKLFSDEDEDDDDEPAVSAGSTSTSSGRGKTDVLFSDDEDGHPEAAAAAVAQEDAPTAATAQARAVKVHKLFSSSESEADDGAGGAPTAVSPAVAAAGLDSSSDLSEFSDDDDAGVAKGAEQEEKEHVNDSFSDCSSFSDDVPDDTRVVVGGLFGPLPPSCWGARPGPVELAHAPARLGAAELQAENDALRARLVELQTSIARRAEAPATRERLLFQGGGAGPDDFEDDEPTLVDDGTLNLLAAVRGVGISGDGHGGAAGAAMMALREAEDGLGCTYRADELPMWAAGPGGVTESTASAVDSVFQAMGHEEAGAAALKYDDLAAAASSLSTAASTDVYKTADTAESTLEFVQQEQRRRVSKLLSEGKKQQDERHWREATAAFEAAAEILPGDPSVEKAASEARARRAAVLRHQQMLGVACFEAADYHGSEAWFQRALKLAPPQQLPPLREALRHCQQTRRALAEAAQLIGAQAYVADRYDVAIARFEEALALDAATPGTELAREALVSAAVRRPLRPFWRPF